MPENEFNGAGGGLQIPPLPPPEPLQDEPLEDLLENLLEEDEDDALDGALAEALRLARAKALLWRGRSEEQITWILRGEIDLAMKRHRGPREWLNIGRAVVELEAEAMRQSGANNPSGKRYSAKWAEIAPPQIAKMVQSSRSYAKWLYLNREAIKPFMASLDPDQRDRLGHPLSIKNHFEAWQKRQAEAAARALARAEGRPFEPVPEPGPLGRLARPAPGSAAAAARVEMSELIADLRAAADGLPRGDLHFDLSVDHRAEESARNFLDLYPEPDNLIDDFVIGLLLNRDPERFLHIAASYLQQTPSEAVKILAELLRKRSRAERERIMALAQRIRRPGS